MMLTYIMNMLSAYIVAVDENNRNITMEIFELEKE